MEPRPRALALVGIFVVLLAFHLWLLYRMVTAANWLLAALLLIAIGLFGWRILHYSKALGVVHGKVPLVPAQELRQMRVMAPVLAGLLALHGWLILQTLAMEPSLERTVFLMLLLLAVVVFVARLAFTAWRYAKLRKAA